MGWFGFALLAGLASAANVGLSKVLVARRSAPLQVGGATHLAGGLLCLPLLPLLGARADLGPAVMAGLAGMGVVTTLANALYFRALETTELSAIDFFLRTSSLWTFVFGVALLGEPAAARPLLGALLIVASVATLSQQVASGRAPGGRSGPRLRLEAGQRLALGAALLFGVGNVIDKALSPAFDPLLYTALNLLLTGAGMLAISRAPARGILAPELRSAVGLGVAATFALAQLFIIEAFAAGGSAGRVILVAQVRLLILLAAGVVVFGERERVARKLAAAAVMLAGLAVLYAP